MYVAAYDMVQTITLEKPFRINDTNGTPIMTSSSEYWKLFRTPDGTINLTVTDPGDARQ